MTENIKKTLKVLSGSLCENCGKQLKVVKMRFGSDRQITLPCECVIKQRQRQERQTQRQQMLELLQRRGFQSGKYARMTFASWCDHPIILKTAEAYMDSLELKNRNWLYLYGENGLGKTHIAIATARHIAIQCQWDPAIFQWAEYCSLIQHSWHDTSIKVDWNMIRRAVVLVLDDIDKKTATEWALGKLYEVIDYRYINELPTIITANRSILELSTLWNKTKETENLSHAIISRIIGQLAKVLHFKGQDYRFTKQCFQE